MSVVIKYVIHYNIVCLLSNVFNVNDSCRFDYLLQQTEIFSHFMQNSQSGKPTGKPKGRPRKTPKAPEGE